MRLTMQVGIADAEFVKFLSALGPGMIRSHFEAEVIHFSVLNDLREKKLKPPLRPIYPQGTLDSNFYIDFRREEIGKDLTQFTVSHTIFGALGVVFLQPADDRHSNLDYKTPPIPSWEETRNLLNKFLQTRPYLKDSSDRDNQEILYGLQNITFEPGNLHTRRTKLQRAIVEAYLNNIHISLGTSVDQSWLTSTQEFIVQLPLHDALAEVDSFIKTHPVDEDLEIQHFALGPGEVYGVEITHEVLGILWGVTLQALIGNYTKIQYTPPTYQSIKARDIASQNSDPNSSITSLLNPDWARSYFVSLVKHLGIDMREDPPAVQIPEKSSQPDRANPNRKGGRPKDPNNEWAYREVHELGRDPKDVYPEWKARKGKDYIDLMADPLESFKKAIKRK